MHGCVLAGCIITVVAVVLWLDTTERTQVSISHVQLRRNGASCSVSFEAANSSHAALHAELRASLYYPMDHGRGAMTWELAGRTRFSVRLAPGEKKRLNQEIPVIRAPITLLPEVIVLAVNGDSD